MYRGILYILKLIRVKNIVISILAILFFSYSLSGYSTLHLVYCLIVVSGYLIGGNIINDYYDYKVDLINNPKRPLVNQFITLESAYKLGLFFLISSFMISTIFNSDTILISLFTLTILFLYTTKFKNIPLLGNILISTLVGLIFLFSELALTGQLLKGWPCFILAFILNFCRELIKDMEDIKGDAINNIKTFPVVFGFDTSKHLLVFLILSFIVISILPVIRSYFTGIYLPLLLFVHIPLFYIIILIFDDLTSKRCRRVSNLIKMIYVCGLFIILFSLK